MNYLDDIISDEEFFFGVPDCIFHGNDYKEHIEKAFNLTKGILNLEKFESDKIQKMIGVEPGYIYDFNLTVNGKNENFHVQRMSDYVDGLRLIEGLNQILKNSGYAGDKYFYEIHGSVFDFGIAFTNKEKEEELIEAELIYRPNQ